MAPKRIQGQRTKGRQIAIRVPAEPTRADLEMAFGQANGAEASLLGELESVQAVRGRLKEMWNALLEKEAGR